MKYVIKQSKEFPGWWVVTDTENMIVCRFKDGDFNGSQKFTALNDITSIEQARELPRLARELADWLAKNHLDKVFPKK